MQSTPPSISRHSVFVRFTAVNPVGLSLTTHFHTTQRSSTNYGSVCNNPKLIQTIAATPSRTSNRNIDSPNLSDSPSTRRFWTWKHTGNTILDWREQTWHGVQANTSPIWNWNIQNAHGTIKTISDLKSNSRIESNWLCRHCGHQSIRFPENRWQNGNETDIEASKSKPNSRFGKLIQNKIKIEMRSHVGSPTTCTSSIHHLRHTLYLENAPNAVTTIQLCSKSKTKIQLCTNLYSNHNHASFNFVLTTLPNLISYKIKSIPHLIFSQSEMDLHAHEKNENTMEID